MSGKYLSKELRKDSDFILAVIDATIAEYGMAKLDCGHETDGTQIILAPQKDGTYLALCPLCVYIKKEADISGD